MYHLNTLRKRFGIFLILYLLPGIASSQVANPYFLNGSASQDNCNCYTLTYAGMNQSGSVWNIYKIDLTEAFDFNFSVYLGSLDQAGADGLAFVLQPISTNIGTTGEGLGFGGVVPSIGVTIDTYQNSNHNDPTYDHIGIQRDGDLFHNSQNNLAGPVTALSNSPNIEDGSWHMFRIVWDPSSKTLIAYIDGEERVSSTIDLINTVFKGDPKVYWGFSASTGGSVNLQRFCTALNPRIKSLSNIETCFGKPIQFVDSSTSFGKIVKWFWDLGDGTTDTLPQIAPHLYAAPGIYDVKLNILGNNGCLSDTFHMKVTVGSDPFAKIGIEPQQPCEGRTLQLIDSSDVDYGTVNSWAWSVDGNLFTEPNPMLNQGLPAGTHAVSLSVKTLEGCISAPVTRILDIQPVPKVSFSAPQVCTGEIVQFSGSNQTPALDITKWVWKGEVGFSDSSGSQPTFSFPGAGSFQVQVQGFSANGCASDIFFGTAEIFGTDADAGADTVVAIGQPFQLRGSGGVSYSWSPASGLSDPDIANPVATFRNDTELILTASSPAGCSSSDTIKIRVFKGPEIYVPTAFTPNGDGLNDILKAFPVGLTFDYLKIFDRWGKEVFNTRDPRLGWDGLVGAKQMSTGTYVWVTRGIEPSGKVFTRQGTVTLIR